MDLRPVILDRALIGTSVDDPSKPFPRSAFRAATYGDALDALSPRNGFFGDALQDVDVGLYKNFDGFRSGQRVTLRIETFNVFNWVQFGFPTTDINSPSFGRILGTAAGYSPRQVQVAVRYAF